MRESLNTIWNIGSAELIGIAIQLLLMSCVAGVIVLGIAYCIFKYVAQPVIEQFFDNIREF